VRSDPAEFELVAPGSLPAVLSLLAEQPGTWLPIAGGTDVMVLYAAGKLPAGKLVSLWNLPELRRFDVSAREVRIGAAATYTDIRNHAVIGKDFPLLSTAAAWTGSIANQNRGTLGGNIVNASPAADSLPALLVYDADLILTSVRGERRVSYNSFHVSYKKTILAPDELVLSVCLPRRFDGYFAHTRKVGARNAQAISKVCIALGSVAPVPLRMSQTEAVIKESALDGATAKRARLAAIEEVRPIDDIRSTVAYRKAVSGNLVEEFLTRMAASPTKA